MNDDLVKTLREKTEEADLDTILKSTLGGYSRKSVREYIAMMRQQQYDLQQSFSEELQLSQAERERLIQELEQANQRAEAAEGALDRARPLIEKSMGLEKDMDEAIERIQADTTRLEELHQQVEQQTAELQGVRNERDDLRGQLEQKESELLSLRERLARHTDEPTAVSPAEPAEPERADLLTQSESMKIQLSILTRERETAAKRIESAIRQEKLLFHTLNECRAELESRRDQNQCLEAENKDLTQRLSEQIWQNIYLNREVTHMQTLNRQLQQKLEACEKDTRNAGDGFSWNFEG